MLQNAKQFLLLEKKEFGELEYEDEAGKKSLEIFHRALGGKIIELKNHGHYTLNDMGTEQFPELLKVILA